LTPPLPPPRSTLFPYTTLFRSRHDLVGLAAVQRVDEVPAHPRQRIDRLRDYRPAEQRSEAQRRQRYDRYQRVPKRVPHDHAALRSEEHTSELQSRENLVCRLLL